MTASPELLPAKSSRRLPIVLLVLSAALNVFLGYLIYETVPLGRLYGHLGRIPAPTIVKYRSWPTWLTDLRPAIVTGQSREEERPENQLPRFRGKLTHLLFVLQDTAEEIEQLRRTMDMWAKHPPCLLDSMPTSHGHSEIILVFYFDSAPRDKTVSHLRSLLRRLPADAKSCFAAVEMRHAHLKRLPRSASAAEERAQWQRVFEGLLTHHAGLKDVNHVAILGSECRPVQPDWLNQLDYQTRPPNDPVWMRGSIFRGVVERPPMDLGQLIRLSPAGLYFFADAAFSDFYLTRVKPWIKNITDHASANPSFRAEYADRWTVDIFQYLASDHENKTWFAVSHHFRHTNLIGDYHGRNVSLAYLQRELPDTVLVCGEIVP